MIRRWRSLIALVGAALCSLVWSGCHGPQQRAREEAVQRWNMARAQVKARLAADQFEAGNIAAAGGELAEAQRLDPDNPDLVPLLARVWLANGKVAQAARLLEQTHLEGTRQAEIEYLLGIVCQQQQRWDEALAAFTRASASNPAEVAYVVAAAQVHLQLGEPQQALDLLTAAQSRFGWTNGYQAAVAECQEQLGNWPAACAAWRQVAQARGAELELKERLAVALYRAGHFAEAVPVLLDLLAERGDVARPLRLMLADCYLSQHQTAAARDQAQLVLRIEPDNARALRLLARCFAESGDFEAALRVARQAQAADRDEARTLELLAALAWRAGSNDLAVGTATRLLELDSSNPVANHLLSSSRIPDVTDTTP